MICFIKEEGTAFIRIFETKDFKKRLRNLRPGNPRELKVFRIIKDTLQGDEKLLHSHYAKSNVKNGWFRFHESMGSIDIKSLRKKVEIQRNKIKDRRDNFRYKVNNDISTYLKELKKHNSDYIFINIPMISSNLIYTESIIEDCIDEGQLSIIETHNITNFGVTSKDEYDRIKRVSQALLAVNSITAACEIARISVKEFIRYKPIIFGNYRYVHFELNEDEYYF